MEAPSEVDTAIHLHVPIRLLMFIAIMLSAAAQDAA